MIKQRTVRIIMSLAVVASAFCLSACETTKGSAQPENLTGDQQPTHERHPTGIESQSPRD